MAAIVTGGGAGIGAATAALLTAHGARVAVLDVAAPTSGDEHLHVQADVTDRDAVDTAVARVIDEFGHLDILVNNAGIGATGDVAATTDDEWHRLVDVNVIGMARVTAACLPHLRRSDHAAIVNTSSIVAILGVPQRAAYAASKGAVLSMTLAMAADYVHEGIRVNAVAPGTTDTPWIGRLLADADDPDAAREALRARQPLGRLVSAEEVAHAIVSLASPAAASTTGTILTVDGGMGSLRLPS
ncbi:MAG: SDR family oxidoreductase [Nitriliruptor sp.]|nr:MAG: SDR family oxidoreductase [Nitriliruptor sp.]